MDRAPDRYRYVLERPIVMEPGKRWTYCGGATALLGRIIAKGTSRPLHEYAREMLFDPLGMAPTDWYTGRDGELIAASGIRMLPPGHVQRVRRGQAPGPAKPYCRIAGHAPMISETMIPPRMSRTEIALMRVIQ